MISNHVTLIPIRNMSRALNFYTKKLGGSLKMRGTGDMKNWWASISVAKSEIWLIKPEKYEGRKLSYNNFVVKNIRKEVKELAKRGVKFDAAEKIPGAKIEGPISFSPYGSSAFFKDTEGNMLMLFQEPKM